MTVRSPIPALLWEIWRVTRAEAAWKLAVGIAGGLAVLALSAAFAPAGDARRYEDVMDNAAAAAMIVLILPHLVSWLSLGRLNGGRPGFPLYLQYTRPVRTAVIVGLPMMYLTVLSSAIYFASALLLRAASGYAFPLLPIAAWVAALTVVFLAATWATRNRSIQMLVIMSATLRALVLAINRLTAVELPGGYDWPPRLWPTLFDFPRTDYAWIALIGVASFGVTIAMVMRQRRGDDLATSSERTGWAAAAATPGDGLWGRLDLFRVPCPTSSATRAQVWLDLKSNGSPVLSLGVAFAIVILLSSAVAGPIDAAINADPDVSCPIGECFYARAWPPLLAPFSLFAVLVLGGNAFGIRRKQGRAYISAFEATHGHGTAQVTALKLLVKSACVLTALFAIGGSIWVSLPLLGDAVFIQMWNVPLSSLQSELKSAIAGLAGYEQLSLAVVAVTGVVAWVASAAVLAALWTRYPRGLNIAASLLLLLALASAVLALAAWRGIGPQISIGAILRTMSWAALAAIAVATAYLARRAFVEQLLTIRHATVVVLLTAAFAAAWLTMLRVGGLSIADMPTADAVRTLTPALLLLAISVLAPWSYSRVRHT